ncbi:MAG: Dam family site-specific DNA-(adenine-N6)-methyltransferase [Planctomycetaceae bacterium]
MTTVVTSGHRSSFHEVSCRPFLRWAGSKQLLLAKFAPYLPKSFGTYFEPFLGSGALFFQLQPRTAKLSDLCSDVIHTFCAVRDNVNSVSSYIARLSVNRETYYDVRAKRARGRLKRAAEFIYLNHTCWNGLYRVNLNGDFNVPFGNPKTTRLLDTENLRRCSVALNAARTSIECQDFEAAVKSATKGDFVYFDPPYVTGHNNNGFIEYNEYIFSWLDQQRLADVCRMLRNQGVFVLVSNACHEPLLKLYDGFDVIKIERSSTLAADKTKRHRITEALIIGDPKGRSNTLPTSRRSAFRG